MHAQKAMKATMLVFSHFNSGLCGMISFVIINVCVLLSKGRAWMQLCLFLLFFNPNLYSLALYGNISVRQIYNRTLL